MPASIGIAFVTLPFLAHASAQGKKVHHHA